jgi:hypothetical protein
MVPSRLAEAQITAQERLRTIVARGITQRWRTLGSYDEEDVDVFLKAVVPFVIAANRQSVLLTDAYLARALGRQPLGVDAMGILKALRNIVTPGQLYRRPFVTVWTALSKGTPYLQAVDAGLARATDIATADVQMAQRATMQVVQDATYPRIRGWQRRADANACAYCRMIDGAFVKKASAMPLHPGCGCGLEPQFIHAPETPVPEGVEVFEHGELGPTIGSAEHEHTVL